MSARKDTMRFVILLLKVFVATAQTNLFIENDTLSDMTCSGSDVLFTHNQFNTIKCAVLCENGNRCSGYTFRSTDGQCTGCQNGDGNLNAGEAGLAYFVPKNRKWGLDCTSDYVCTGENQQCMDGVCVCTPGYSFQATTWTCVATCSPYGDTFQKYDGYRILGNNYRQLLGRAVSGCIDACLADAACVSFDFSYTYTVHTVCSLQRVTALDVPADFDESEIFEYHQRNC